MIVCLSNNKDFTCKCSEYLHVKSLEELESLNEFILLLDIDHIKDSRAYFFDSLKLITTCKAIFCLTCNPNFAEGTQLLSLNINGYGNINMAKQNLEDAIKVIEQGSIWLYPEFLQMMIKSFSKNLHEVNQEELNLLSSREQEIASLVKEGLSNKEIAKNSNITERTVKAHLSSIYEKLKIKDRVALVIKLSTNVQ